MASPPPAPLSNELRAFLAGRTNANSELVTAGVPAAIVAVGGATTGVVVAPVVFNTGTDVSWWLALELSTGGTIKKASGAAPALASPGTVPVGAVPAGTAANVGAFRRFGTRTSAWGLPRPVTTS